MAVSFPVLPLLSSWSVPSRGWSEPRRQIEFVHWNPHWQCFSGHPECAANATAAVDALLGKGVDFMNVVELESSGFYTPSGWQSLAARQSCGRDWDTLFFNTKRWRRLANQSGACLHQMANSNSSH